MQAKTKIICTLGPSSDSTEKISQLIDAGMNVARLNFSHGSHDVHLEVINRLKALRSQKNRPLALLLDTKGPEVRVGDLGEDLIVKRSEEYILCAKKCAKTDICISPASILPVLKPGIKVLFDDGLISSTVVSTSELGVSIRMDNDGILKSGKGINIPNAQLCLPSVTEQDKKDIVFGVENGVDIIALSFVCSAEAVLEVKKLLADMGKAEIKVYAKIETALSVKNFDAIVHAADGIMVARGDLGVEVTLTEVPVLQKKFIQGCLQLAKPVIIATQMLESMIYHPRPTRAEVSDVANAIFDGASAVMLSGETAIGKYPVETVEMMKGITLSAEREYSYLDYFNRINKNTFYDVSSSVAVASVKTAYSSIAKGIIACTSSGFTARCISRFRPQMPIIAITHSTQVYHQLAMSWGVIPVLNEMKSLRQAVKCATDYALDCKLLQFGDLVVITSGTPFGVAGSTNIMLVENLGEVLVRGIASKGASVQGQVAIVLSEDEKEMHHLKNKIAVLTKCSGEYEPLLQGALGVILQNHPDDHVSEKCLKKIAKKLDIPYMFRADGASNILKEGQFVVFEPAKGLVFCSKLEAL